MPLSDLFRHDEVAPMPAEILSEQAAWKPIWPAVMQDIMALLRQEGLHDVKQFSSHFGWGKLAYGDPAVTDPHYFYASGVILRVSPTEDIAKYLMAEDSSWLVPYLRRSGTSINGPRSIEATRLNVLGNLYIEIMYRDGSRLRSRNLPTRRGHGRAVSLSRAIADMTQDRTFRHKTRRHRAIRRSILRGG